MSTRPEIAIFPDAATLAGAAAERIHRVATDAIRERGHFDLVLAGGSTPEAAYTLLGSSSHPAHATMSQWRLFVGDERMVPLDDARSNFGMARRTLLADGPIPDDHIFPMRTDLPSPEAVATDYSTTLAQVFDIPTDGPPPCFDLILLGLGDDGHTASLFPGKPALEATKWVTASPPGELPPPVDRVTLTFPVLNAARAVLFLVGGDKKAAAVAEILEGSPPITDRPAVGVRPEHGRLIWLLDAGAASGLRSSPG